MTDQIGNTVNKIINDLKPDSNLFKDHLFITTTLPYINSNAHIGHAFEFVLADFIARIFKSYGKTVVFNIGTDEHGQKVHQKAIEEGKPTLEYCDIMAGKWASFCVQFEINCDNFYRTTNHYHIEKVQKYFKSIRKELYPSTYEGMYCEGCESFKTSKDIIDGKCEQHPNGILKSIKETNLFFPLSKYKVNIVDPDRILVNPILANELRSIIDNIDDMSVTRQLVEWGIDMPDTDQKIYVWAEALLNYVFAAGYTPENPFPIIHASQDTEFNKNWNNSLIVCGKDNLKFQALILPCLLAATGINPPSKVLVHGMILDDKGKKMSKSEGNVIDPVEMVKKYGVDTVRYYLLAGLNTFQDSSFSESAMILKWNNDIVNGFGNLISRTLHLIDIQKTEIKEIDPGYKSTIDRYLEIADQHFQNFNVKDGFEEINGLISWCNKYINDTKPWDKTCENPESVLNVLYYILKNASKYYIAAMPNIGNDLNKSIDERKKVILFNRLDNK